MSTAIAIISLLVALTVVYYVYNNHHVIDSYTSAQPPPPFQTNVSQIQPYMSYEHPIQGIDCTSDCPNDAVVAGGNYHYLDGYPVEHYGYGDRWRDGRGYGHGRGYGYGSGYGYGRGYGRGGCGRGPCGR